MTPNDFIAHRGWQRRYPENSLLAIEKAIAAGALHVETDVLMTADHQLVLCHDQHLNRLCGVARDIDRLSWDELKTLSPAEPGRLGDQFNHIQFSLLSEALALLAENPAVTLYVEIKRSALRVFGQKRVADSLFSILQQAPAQCVVISFDLPVLLYLQTLGWRRLGLVLSNWHQLAAAELTQLAPEILFCDDEQLPADIDFSTLPYPSAVYEVDQIKRARWLKQRGAAKIETFAIGEMLAAL